MSQKENATAKLQVRAYEALGGYLEDNHKKILEIEILPPAIKPPNGLFLQDGLNLGVPKKILALAFVEARKVFMAKFENEDKESQALALKASRVLLLFETDHLTAANFRKRRLLALKTDTTPAAQLAYRKALQYEFCFLDSILTSPLHRQSKSPTLWHHRSWLFDLFRPSILELVPENIRADFWRAELKSICKSGERHPHNYYAWQYARRLEERVDDMEATIEFTEIVKTWCCKHPGDTSGWSCLLYLLPKVEPLAKRTTFIREVLSYALRLQFEHESLWVFIRTIVAHETLQENRAELFTSLMEYGKEMKDGSPVLVERVQRTLDWIRQHGDMDHIRNASVT
jgi:hypothetical protein